MNVGYFLSLFAVVASGAVLPVVPTGAAVSVAAALAEQDHLILILTVVMSGAAGAYVSDLATYAALRWAAGRAVHRSGRITRWLGHRREEAVITRVRRQLADHELRTLLLSRLIPGGQLPVLIAAALGEYSWRRYAVADIAAAVLWSILYAATGLAGRAVFPQAWEGVTSGIALVVLISALTTLWGRRSHGKAHVGP